MDPHETTPHMWSIACIPTDYDAHTEATIYHVHNRDSKLYIETTLDGHALPLNAIPPSEPFHAYTSCHRICRYAETSQGVIPGLIIDSCNIATKDPELSGYWVFPFLEDLADFDWIETWEKDMLAEVLFARVREPQEVAGSLFDELMNLDFVIEYQCKRERHEREWKQPAMNVVRRDAARRERKRNGRDEMQVE
ncbi:hypothetical protein BDW74DRAFT_179154 [Aspergillus multicolor]|uniref:uncharacterized protein n=1 Tax=Aspergillus multicolor TaxID=41759 RepID=UPI003CCE42B4